MSDRSVPNAWPPDTDILAAVEKAGGNVAAAARAMGFSSSSLRNKLERMQYEPPKADSGEVLRNVTSDDPAEWGDVEGLLKRRGLRMDQWTVKGARVNEWGDPVSPMTQLRVDLMPTLDLIYPARSDGWIAPKVPKRAKNGKPELVAFMGDHHAPHHDEELHAATLAWLAEFQPDRVIVLGDLLDYDGVSRHRKDPAWSTTMQDTIDAGYGILRGYVEASPATQFQALNGNHEARLRNAVLDQLQAIHGLTRAGGDEHPVLSTPFLLRMDELGIEWIGGDGSYEHEQILVTSELAARHGWIARKGSGASALSTLEHLRHSIVIGHTHRQSVVFHTSHSITGEPKTLTGVEAGTLARVRGGLGYAVSPSWQAGFAAASIWPDGTFKIDLASWINDRLLFRDWNYAP